MPAAALNLSPLAAEAELPFWSAPFGVALLEAVRLYPGQRFLDLGCGSGFPALELAARLGPRGRGWGLDPDPAVLALARTRQEAKGIGNVSFLEGVAEALPFEDRSLDLVVSNNGLNNVQDPEQALRELARVLEPRGQLVFTANLPGTFGLFYSYLEGLLEECRLEDRMSAVQAHIQAKRPTLETWLDRVEAAGFTLRRCQELAFTWTFLDGTALFQHPCIRDHFLPAWAELLPEDFLPFLQGRLDRLALERGGLRLEVPFLCVEAIR